MMWNKGRNIDEVKGSMNVNKEGNKLFYYGRRDKLFWWKLKGIPGYQCVFFNAKMLKENNGEFSSHQSSLYLNMCSNILHSQISWAIGRNDKLEFALGTGMIIGILDDIIKTIIHLNF